MGPIPTRDFLQLEKKTKTKKQKQKPTHFCGTSPYVFMCDYPPMGVHKCAWIGVGTVGMQSLLSAMQCHTVTFETLVMLIVRRFWMMIFLMAWFWVIVTVKWGRNWSKKARAGHLSTIFWPPLVLAFQVNAHC